MPQIDDPSSPEAAWRLPEDHTSSTIALHEENGVATPFDCLILAEQQTREVATALTYFLDSAAGDAARTDRTGRGEGIGCGFSTCVGLRACRQTK